MKRLIQFALATFLIYSVTAVHAQNKQQSTWGFSGFVKPKENPILGADSTKTFICPVKKAEVKWQRADVFNPAAIVHNGNIFLLTR